MRNLMWLINFSLKDIFQQRKLYLFLTLNLFIGTFGFLAIQFFQSSLKLDLASRAQDMLGGDYSISSSRKFTSEELAFLERDAPFSKKTSVMEFFAMLKTPHNSRLVSVRAFDQDYPFYGKIGSEKSNLDYNAETVWIDPELVKMLGIDIHQTPLQLGEATLDKVEAITHDSSRFFRGAGLAPVIYISQKKLGALGLITQGSTLRTFLIYKTSPETDLKLVQDQFNKNTTDATIKFETADQRSEGSNSMFKYFTDYLGLVAIVSISLCFLSGGYLMRWAFEQKVITIGIFKTLGMADFKIQIIHIFQILVISFISFVLSLGLFYLIQPLLNFYFAKNNLPFVLTIQGSTLIFCLILSLFSPLMMFMPVNISISQLNPKDLFLNQVRNTKTNFAVYLWYGLCFLSFWGLSFYQSKSYKVASLFAFGLLLVVFILKMLLLGLFYFIRKYLSQCSLHWTTVYAIRSVINKKKIADIVFITFTMAVLILTLLPHLKQSIVGEITPQQKSSLPRLFMFDVQSSQKAGLEQLATEFLESKLDFTPLVRSRILKINTIDYDRLDNTSSMTTREEDEELRFRNRGVNLTYEQELKESEIITEGKWNTEKFSGIGLPEISLEEKYATRVGAKLNDEMTFDVQGLEIKGRVTSLRKVRWTSFSPNFFILFQSGVLEEAPQNFLTSVSTTKEHLEFQNAVVSQFPNISIIDVKQTVENVLVFIQQMSLALQLMAVISIILGLFIFIVLIRTQINERLNEFNLLKTLGTDTKTIQKIIFIQFLFILSLSLVIGIGMGMLLTHILVHSVFNITTQFDVVSVSLVSLILLPLAYGIIYQATRHLNRLSPLSLIRS